MRTPRSLLALLAGSFAALAAAACADRRGMAPAPAVDAGAPITPKVRSLLSQLTLDEKLSLVRAGTDPQRLGQAGYTPGVPRLGIPPRRDADALGINVYEDATAPPTRMAIAATFDRDAALRLGRLEGAEGRALQMDLLYGPQVDLARTPGWWRNFTTYGEDPYLSGQMATGEIEGIQSQGLMAQPKHLAFYDGQYENIPSVVDEQAAQELYLAPFEAAVTGARPSSVMCSYATFRIPSLQREAHHACGNAGLLQAILRRRWGFRGFVLADYGATHGTEFLLRGLDAAFPRDVGLRYFGDDLKRRVAPGSAAFDRAYADALDGAVTRILLQMERFGLLDAAPPARPALDPNAGARVSEALSEEAAVLLKNDGDLLPLDAEGVGSVAVVGPVSTLLVSSPGGERSRGFGDRNLVSPLQALRALAPRATFASAPGVDRVGTLVPSSCLRAPGGEAGLLRTGSDGSRRIDPTLDLASSAGLTPGVTYTWTGQIRIPARDVHALWVQTTIGRFCQGADGHEVVDPTGDCGMAGRFAGGDVTVILDGGRVKLDRVDTLLPNTYPDGLTTNGRYLGLSTVGAYLDGGDAAPGWHAIELRWSPHPSIAAPPTLRLRWAPLQAGIGAAVAIARRAEVALVLVDDGGLPGSGAARGPGEVASLGAYQDRLVSQVAAANPNTAVVLYTRNPVRMPWLDQVRAVLEMWYPGQEGGTSTAKLLLGRACPGGKLPITFPASSEDTPFHGRPERITTAAPDGYLHWSEGLFMGYRWYDQRGIAPLFPFGHGLSYTRFEYGRLGLAPSRDGGVDVSFRVRNVGRRAGVEVAQVYVGPSRAAPPGLQQAPKKLVQLRRVALAPGEGVDVSLHVAARELSAWSVEEQRWRLGTGEREVLVGSSSRDVRLRGSALVR